jgi:hypothetical protein
VREQDYRPESVQNSKDTEELSMRKKKTVQYKAKRNLFKAQTFALNEISFNDDDSYDVELMRRLIFENGGIVVESDAKANFAVFGDGYDKEVWKRGGVDQLNRNIVHFRWIDACIQNVKIVNHTEALHM